MCCPIQLQVYYFIGSHAENEVDANQMLCIAKTIEKSACSNGCEWVNDASCVKCFECSAGVEKSYIRTFLFT